MILKIIKISAKVLLVIVCFAIITLRVLLWNSEQGKIQLTQDIPSSLNILDKRYEGSISSARKEIKQLIQERKIPGLSVAIGKEDSIIWSEAFGYSDLFKKVKALPSTLFRVASISKSFTASGMMKLVGQKKLDLQAPVQQYVPEFPDKGYKITTGLLASHKAGIRNYRDDSETINTKHYDNVIASLEKFKNDSLVFVPGTGFEYSGYGYVLLSTVIERAAGKDFLSYMHDEVFEPLDMRSTIPEQINDSVRNKTVFYDNVTPYSLNGEIVLSPYNDFSCKWATGGFLSTSEDLIRFGNTHIYKNQHSFLEKKLLDSLLKPRVMQMGILGYGYGWMTARDPYLRKVYFHFGASSGGTSVLIIFPEQKFSIAILANLGHAKFPYNRLMNITNCFVSRPVLTFYSILFLSALIYLLMKSIHLFRKRKIKKHETNLV